MGKVAPVWERERERNIIFFLKEKKLGAKERGRVLDLGLECGQACLEGLEPLLGFRDLALERGQTRGARCCFTCALDHVP